MCDGRELVFVYGTLRPGGSNHWRMDGAEFIASGHVMGEMYRIDWYPGVVLGGSGRVVGQVFAVGPEQLARLDEFEGVSAAEVAGSEYRRVKTAVLTDGNELQAWIWEWIGPVDERIKVESGDWLAEGG
jgi:gamma-glutamylcyclotransferase (GGCT)/AIG2-like uncharacterized protein YtfP